MTVKQSKPIEVFFSYSHKDQRLRDQLETQLSLLKREGLISSWHDRKIVAGQEWKGQIDKYLNTAQIILLLISPDFVASDYCYDLEMKRALERHEAGEAKVIPVILRRTDWKSAPFHNLQALPKDGKPVMNWANRDEAFFDIVQGIRKATEELSQIASTIRVISDSPISSSPALPVHLPLITQIDTIIPTARILIVEDNIAIQELLRVILREEGYDTFEIGSGDEALKYAQEYRPDLVLLDIRLEGGINGFDVLRQLRNAAINIPIIMMTQNSPKDYYLVKGLKLGADDFIEKPFAIDEMLARIEVRLRKTH